MLSSSDTDENEEANEDEGEEAGKQIEVETVVPFRDLETESEPEQQSSVSNFDLLSDSDEEQSTASDALALSNMPGRGCGHNVAWDGQIADSSSGSDDDTLPYNWASWRGAVADEQRSQSSELPACQAALDTVDAKPLGHPSLGSDPPRKGSKFQKILLK